MMALIVDISDSTWLLQALIADFEVSEGIYSCARIEDYDYVCLWLGANVMLEYSCDEVHKYGTLKCFLAPFSP